MSDWWSTVFVWLLIAAPFLWLCSLVLLFKWSKFWRFFGLNLLLLIGYLWVLSSPQLTNFGHDEYGLGRLFAMLVALLLHVLLGFGYAVTHRLQHSSAD